MVLLCHLRALSLLMKPDDSIKLLKGTGNPRKMPTRGPVCAALACGLPYYGDKPLLDYIEDGIRKHVWSFEGDATCTFKPIKGVETIEFNELVRRFNDDVWCSENSDHPIAYMRAIFDKLSALDERLKTMKPLLKIQHGENFALIPSGLSLEEQQKMLVDMEQQFNAPSTPS